MNTIQHILRTTALSAVLLPAVPLQAGDGKAPKAPIPCPVPEDPFADRLFGDWGGVRTSLLNHGITIDLDGSYSFQGVANGGLERFSDYGNVFSGNLKVVLDTGKAGLWPGGFLTARVEGRGGNSALARAGTTSPVNNDALLPLIPGSLKDGGWGLTELTYAQFFTKRFGLVGGLINTDPGDANPIAGFLGSNDHFLNTGFLYSSAVVSTVPNVTPGGGLVFLANEANHFKLLAIGTNETAGENPFENYEGTTFLGEWHTTYKLGDRPGGMTFTGTYGINQERVRLTDDPRVLLGDLVRGRSLTTDEEAWSLMWNGFQYLSGDETHGWGLFGRFGVSDGDPSLVRWTAAAGVGGVGLIPGRDKDRWGIGVFHQDFTDKGVLAAVNIDGETGAEAFYNIALHRGLNLTLDAQVIDSAINAADTVVVLGARVGLRF